MRTAGRASFAWLSPAWLTGPIFDKELRVSSRRRRSYALRMFYIVMLTVFVAVVWLGVAYMEGDATLQQSRMAAAGKQIVRTVVLFQFIAAQILAIIMLSSAISDEIYHRTLGLLMTTPISGLQIVMGKILSRLLQLVLLLAISLPMLAIIRLFGGVSWSYLLSSLCLTLTASVFAGSISLLLSIRNRHAYGVIVRTVFLLGFLYFMVPALAAAAWQLILPRFGVNPNATSTVVLAFATVFLHVNPFGGIAVLTQEMITPTAMPVVYSWPVQCGVMLALAAVVVGWTVGVVRRTALRQATGQLETERRSGRSRRRKSPAASEAEDDAARTIQRVHGPPVVWKELRAPFIQGNDNRNSYIGLGVAVAALLLMYLSAARNRVLDENFTHVSYVMLFLFMGVIVNIVYAATRITAERESQSWILLLTTPLSEREILLGKGVSAFRRSLPIWGLLAGHVLLFVLVGYIHPVAIVHLFMLVAWLTCFLTASGLYFSARFSRTGSAVVATFALALGLWAVGPVVTGLLGALTDNTDPFKAYMWTHPAIQAEIVTSAAAGRDNAAKSWQSLAYGTERILLHEGHRGIGFVRMTTVLTLIAAGYLLAAALFFWRARRHLRRST